MKIKSLSFVLFITAVSCAFAQTKRIAFKSHSGKTVDFKTALENHLFDIGDSNFGILPKIPMRLDTAIIVSDTSIIIKVAYRPYYGVDTSEWIHETQTYTDKNWKMSNESDDVIKKIILEQLHFEVPNTLVIRRSLKKATNQLEEKKENNNLLFIIKGGNGNGPMNGLMILLVGIVLLLSLSTAWVSWKHNQWKAKILKS